jgi:hypothetical protein
MAPRTMGKEVNLIDTDINVDTTIARETTLTMDNILPVLDFPAGLYTLIILGMQLSHVATPKVI